MLIFCVTHTYTHAWPPWALLACGRYINTVLAGSGVDVNFFSTKEERPSSAFPERQSSTVHGGKAASPELQAARDSLASEQAEVDAKARAAEEAHGGGLAHRIAITAEVTVSKIFPAGFGWQGASVIADSNFGFAADSAQFAFTTGLGDGTGVFLGHTTFYALKKAITGDDSIKMGEQMQTGFMLGTAAFHAGTAWQPIVNFLHDSAGCSFNQTLAGTMAGCGVMFFVGLRVARHLYSGFMSAVAAPAYDNLKADAALSISIGGATACFVGTDVSFVANGVDQNWLRGIVGIEDGVSDLVGCATAGSSTAIGFTVVQMGQNVVYPAGRNWVD